MKNKKGSHVEIVLSFVLFVGSIFFVYFLVQPSISKNDKTLEIDSLKEKIKDFLKEDLTLASVKIKITPPTCAKLNNFFGSGEINERLIAVGKSGNLNAMKNGNNLVIETGGNNFINIYSSKEFNAKNGNIAGCQNLNKDQDYSFGLIKTEEHFFESRLLNLSEKYSSNYSGLKSELKIPDSVDFGFGFFYSDGTSFYAGNNSYDINIYSEEIPINYINKNKGFEIGKLTIITW